MPGCNLRSLLSLVSFTLLACGTFPAAAASCEDLAHVALPNTTITLAQSVAAGAFTPPVPSWASAFMRPTPIPAAFCRVTGEMRPTHDSDIKFEVWLPLSGWSGRYESVGNGGFAGSIRYDSMRNPLLAGSAVASTDDGHDGPAIGPTGTDWAFGHPERIIDYGHRAVHLTAVTAKAITGDDPPLVSIPPERQVQGIRRGHRCRELCVRGGIRDGLPEYAS
jgi:feruloyl esterase